jgi:hypothetical protein
MPQTSTLHRMRSFFNREPAESFYRQTPRKPISPELVRGLDVASLAAGLSHQLESWAAHEGIDVRIIFVGELPPVICSAAPETDMRSRRKGWTSLQIIAANMLEEAVRRLSSENLLATFGLPLLLLRDSHSAVRSQLIPSSVWPRSSLTMTRHVRDSLSSLFSKAATLLRRKRISAPLFLALQKRM